MNKSIKKIIAILLAVITMFSGTVTAFASMKVGDKDTFNVKYLNAHYQTGKWKTENGHTHENNGQVAYRTLKKTGEPIYCIQVYKETHKGSQVTGSNLKQTEVWRHELSYKAQQGITKTTIYGYPNTKYSGYSKEEQYLATQALIWEFETGARKNFDSYGNSWVMSLFNNYPKAKEVYRKIIDNAYNHRNKPDFGITKIELKGIGKSNAVTLTDKNNQLSKFKVTCNNNNIAVSQSGNKLTVYAKNNGNLNANIQFMKINTNIDTALGLLGANQTMIYGTLADPISMNLSVEMKLGSLEILKTSNEDGKVANVKFNIKGNGINTTVKTDSKGYVKIDNLKAGSYTVTEIVDDIYQPQKSKTIDVNAGSTTTISFDNVLKKGSLKVVKTAEDNLVEGVKFHLTGTALSGAKVDEMATTNENGVAEFNNILIGTNYTIEEVGTDKRYVVPDVQSSVINWGEVTSINFENKLKKFKVEVTKKDSETTVAQGNATLQGAVYGIYNNGELVDTYETDSDGKFTTKDYVCGNHWTIQEITPSNGYNLDETVYKVGAEPENYELEYNTTSNVCNEDVIKGKIEIIKHSDDGSTQIETPEVGATFEVYLKSAGSYENAKNSEKALLVADEKGYCATPLLPFGTYTVHQTKGNDGAELIPDFDVTINEQGKSYYYLINNAPFKAYLKVVKVDSESGIAIPYEGAGFQIYNPNGEKVEMSFTYPINTTVDTFYTNKDGYLITPQTLDYGKGYKLVEVKAPEGYVLDSTPITFDVVRENSEVEDALTLIKLTKKNNAQKGVIKINKSGEIFSTVKVTEDNRYIPVFKTENLKNAVYEIYAAEDIVTPEGTLHYKKGTLVDTVTTCDDGVAVSKQLYLGKYQIKEKTAPYTFVVDSNVYDVELKYAGQNIVVTSSTVNKFDERQKVEVSLKKQIEIDDLFNIGNNGEIKAVKFGVFANEDIKANDGTVIPKNSLITFAYCREDGKITFDCDLPIGYNFYVQEIATDEHYILSNEKYEFNTKYQGQDVNLIDIKINNGEVIVNEIIRADIKGLKLDEDGLSIKGAKFGLFKADETNFTEDNALMVSTTNENGMFEFNDVPYGTYIVKELEAAFGFVKNDNLYPVNIQTQETINIKAENKFQRGIININKTGEQFVSVKENENGTYTPVFSDINLANAVYEIIAKEDIVTPEGTVKYHKGDVVEEITTDINGKAKTKELYLGKYLVKEKTAPYGSVIDKNVYDVELSYEGENIEVTSKLANQYDERQKVEVTLAKSLEKDELFKIGNNGEITKIQFGLYAKDEILALDGTVIPKDALITSAYCDENGNIKFDCDLPIGYNFYVKEIATDEHYILSDKKYEFNTNYQGQDVSLIDIKINNGEVIVNEIIRADIEGIKVDDSGFAVCGAKFGLFKADETNFTEENALMVSITNEIGAFHFEDVPFGKYIVKELYAPKGYVMDDTSYEVDVQTQDTILIAATNKIVKGSVILTKVNVDNEKLSGATFEVYADVNKDGKYQKNIDRLYKTLEEIEQGVYALDNIPYGYYLVKEVKAPEGYLLDDDYYSFNIETDGQKEIIANSELGFVNKYIKGKLVINKTDENNKPLQGAEFVVMDKDGNVITTLVTDENGYAEYELKYGEYVVKETKSPKHYQLNDKEYKFDIRVNGEIVTLGAVNSLIPIVNMPKTGADVLKKIVPLAVVTSLGAGAIILLVIKKRKNK